MTTKHARAAPSSLSLFIACNAAMQLQESVPPLESTDDEKEGTAAHWVARRYLAGHGAELPMGAKFQSEGQEWEVTPAMLAGAVLYARAMGAPDPEILIEQWVDIPRVHELCNGTPDGRRYFPDARVAYPNGCPPGLPEARFNAGRIKLLRVGDYKFGFRYVEVFENPQLCAYAAGHIDELGLDEMDDDLYIELILVQPRSYHKDGSVRHWRTKAINLRGTLIMANMAIERSIIPLGDMFAPQAKTGKHCLDCRARHVCKALQHQTGHIVDFAYSAERIELDPMSLGQELAIVQDGLKRLEARETGLKAQAEAMIRQGARVPNYGLEPSKSNLTYLEDVTANEIVSLGELINVDLRKRPKLKDLVVTPTQAIELGVDPEVMKHYASRPPGKMTLTRDNSLTARKVFST